MEKLRRSMLFCPANNAKFYYTAPCYKPDCIVFDLEDSVEVSQKDAARDLLSEAIKTLEFDGVEIFVRLNAIDSKYIYDDINAILPGGVRNVKLPFCETKHDIIKLDEILSDIEKKNGIKVGSVKIQAGIESPLGVLNAYEIATASDRIMGLSLGAEDYTACLSIDRTKKGDELLFARSMIVNVANATGIEATDVVWTDINDLEGFRKEVEVAKSLGYYSKSCIHPNQIDILHETLAPTKEQIEEAKRILSHVDMSNINDGGVISVDGKMIDIPVIRKCQNILARAEKVNK